MPGMNGKIVVGGAGIGGLTLALALLRRGVDVVVYEQADQLAEVGAGIQISPNGTRALADLGVLDELAKVSSEPDARCSSVLFTPRAQPPSAAIRCAPGASAYRATSSQYRPQRSP